MNSLRHLTFSGQLVPMLTRASLDDLAWLLQHIAARIAPTTPDAAHALVVAAQTLRAQAVAAGEHRPWLPKGEPAGTQSVCAELTERWHGLPWFRRIRGDVCPPPKKGEKAVTDAFRATVVVDWKHIDFARSVLLFACTNMKYIEGVDTNNVYAATPLVYRDVTLTMQGEE